MGISKKTEVMLLLTACRGILSEGLLEEDIDAYVKKYVSVAEAPEVHAYLTDFNKVGRVDASRGDLVTQLANFIWNKANELDYDPMCPNFEHFDGPLKDRILLLCEELITSICKT